MAYTNLTTGSSGEEVRKLQNALMSVGYDVGSSGADGKFGPATSAAVKKYQKDKGLTVDGIAGKNTLSVLFGNASSGASSGSTSRPSSRKNTAASSPTLTAPAMSYDAGSDQAYQEALKALLEAQKNAPTYANSYEGQLKDLYDRIVNRDKFRYDLNEDALYQQYARQYAEKGRMAMMDTMGQAAALTGGYASTYGQAVGQQQYDAYLQQLNDVIPELYQMAYGQYQDEGERMQQQYAMLGDLADDEYSKYRDAYNQWLTERDYAQGNADTAYDRGYNQWLQRLNQYNTDRDYQLNKENADRQYQLQLEQFRWQQEQAAQEAAARAASSSGGGSSGGGSGGSKGSGSKSSGSSGGGSMTWQEFMKRVPSQAAYGANSASYRGYIEREIDKYGDQLSDADIQKLIEIYGLR